jgi:Domain of unknown function (DUF5666)
MKRLIPAAGVVALALFPAGALANPSRAKVLSVNRHHHTVRLVDAAHAVHAYRYHGTLPRLGLGDTVTYRRAGRSLTHLKRIARAFGTTSFYAKVVRAGTGQVRLRLGDGSAYSLSSKQISKTARAHAAAVSAHSVMLQVLGLRPGESVLISETVDARGDWTVTITLPGSATSAGGEGSGGGSTSGGDSTDDQDAEGAVTQVSDSGMTIRTDSGSLSFSVDPSSGMTDGFAVGDIVDVSYYDDGDGTLTADDVEYVERDATGLVSAVSDGSLTLTDDASGQPVMFTADPADQLFAGVTAGDEVDVTYHQSAGGDVVDGVDDQSSNN